MSPSQSPPRQSQATSSLTEHWPHANLPLKTMKKIGHHLNPIVTLTEYPIKAGVELELIRALTDHELIKIKLAGLEKKEKSVLLQSLEDTLAVKVVQTIGHTALLFQAAKKPNAKLSNIIRYQQG